MSRNSASITLAAPAKINLSLRILGKRPDGFHEIETLMAPLCLADGIEIVHTADHDCTLTCNDPELPSGSDNLCIKAATEFRKSVGLDHGIAISLMKRIPHGAGLGGGSSDAAAVLKGLNELFGHPLVQEELHQIAANIGSDVAFFLGGVPAWCRGRGEIIGHPMTLPERRILLIKPPFPVPTAWAYDHYEKLKNSSNGMSSEKFQRIGEIEIINDLERPVFEKYILLPVLKLWLLEQPWVESAFMTGSGSTLVALISPDASQGSIVNLKEKITGEFGDSFWTTETRFLQKPSDDIHQIQG